MDRGNVLEFLKYCLGIAVGVLPFAAVYGCFVNRRSTDESMKEVTVDIRRPSNEVEDSLTLSLYTLLYLKERRRNSMDTIECRNCVRIVLSDIDGRDMESLLSDSGVIQFVGKNFDIEVAKNEIRELMNGVILHILKYDSSVALPLIRTSKRFLSRTRKSSDCVVILETNKDIALPDGYVLRSGKGDSAFVNFLVIGKHEDVETAIKIINEKYHKFRRKLFFSLRNSAPTVSKTFSPDMRKVTSEYLQKQFATGVSPQDQGSNVEKDYTEENEDFVGVDDKDLFDIDDKRYLDLLNELLEDEGKSKGISKTGLSFEDVHKLEDVEEKPISDAVKISSSDANLDQGISDEDDLFSDRFGVYSLSASGFQPSGIKEDNINQETDGANDAVAEEDGAPDLEDCEENISGGDVEEDFTNRKSYLELLKELLDENCTELLDNEDDGDENEIKPKRRRSGSLRYKDGLLGELQREFEKRKKRLGAQQSLDCEKSEYLKFSSKSTNDSLDITAACPDGSQTIDYKELKRYKMKNQMSAAARRRMFSNNNDNI